MYNKNIIKIASSIIVWTVLISWLSQVQANNTTNMYTNISVSTKAKVEKRLANFLRTIGKYDEEKQTQAYETLQNKIDLYESQFDVNSEIYSVFEMIDLIAEHKLDTQSILSDSQILSHVIYWNDFPHYNTAPVDENPNKETETDPDSDMDDTSNSNNTQLQNEYRADLDTEDLNEVDKNILAWSAKWILNLRVRANLEDIKSETVEFRFNENIDNIGLVGRLYHDGILVWESSQSDARGTVLTIDNIHDFIIGTQTSNIQLELVTQTIGKEEIWKTLSNVRVVSTTFKNNTWTITGDSISDRTYNQESRNFNIVPADVVVSSEIEFEKYVSTANIIITPSVGNNNDNGNIFSTVLESITFQISSLSESGTITIFNSNGVQIGSGAVNSAWNITIDVDSDTISSSGETYRISTTAKGTFIISQDWISYSAGNNTYTSNLESQIFLGQR